MKRRLCSLILLPFLLLYAFPVSAAEKEERKWQDETMYYLMVDRFNNGDNQNDQEVNNNDPSAYQGGDFTGVTGRMDHIKDMGFTTVILSPIFQNEKGGYHGYWTTDFYKINKQFGTMKELEKLVNEAHERDLKVLIDLPVTRVSTAHPWTEDDKKVDWFTNKREVAPEKWLGEMATLNLENKAVTKELIQVANYWSEQTKIDGYYLSDAIHAPVSFWGNFSEGLNKDLYLLGESNEQDVNVNKLAAYQKAGLDGMMNGSMMSPLREQFKNVNESSSETPNLLKEVEASWKDPQLSAHYLDTNKTARFTRDIVQENMFPGTRWMLALTYLYTIPGTPVVYYGSEIALDGGEGVENHGLMNFRIDKELIDYMKKIGDLRQQLPALTRGSYEPLYEKNGMVVFKREYQDETLIVAINNTNETQKVTIPAKELANDKELRGLLNDNLSRAENGDFTIILDREQSEVFVLAEESGINLSFIAALAAVYIIFMVFIYLVWKRGRAAR
ncbi:alpha-amlyase [Bacillaceae bacterium SAS-127]|nr:alpha-amlyase [Bacillaceae bacterium SAS-127]